MPLYSRKNDSQSNRELTQDWSVRYWISNGCSPSKLVMGLALYGRTFRLANSNSNQIGAPTLGPGSIMNFYPFETNNNLSLGSPGSYTNEAGFLSYYEICYLVKERGWTTVFDEEQKSNYAFKNQEWVGYDDIGSIQYKVG